MKSLSAASARKIALAAQGFCDARPQRVGVAHFRRAMKRMNVLQLDSVNVLCRSHFLPVFARLGAYDRDKLDDWLWRSGENVEFLAHAASITSAEVYPLLHHRLSLARWKSGARFLQKHPAYLDAICDEVKRRGPTSIKDLEDAGERTGAWWGWSKGKVALEVLLRTGKLAIAERTKTFLTRYDLRERVIAAAHRGKPTDNKRQLLLLAAKSYGVATDTDLADYFRLKVTECRPILRALTDEGHLEEVRVEGWDERAYLAKGVKRPPKFEVKARALLSPFDPVVWFRPRALRMFNFHYRIEIYTPEKKRKFGYYVLPFLLGDEIVARVDLKADRHGGKLLVQAAHIEDGHDGDTVAAALSTTLDEMASWMHLDEVKVCRRGKLAATLRAQRR